MIQSKPKDEKYTPIKYVKLVRSVIGIIDLDPASSEIGNSRIKATNFFSKEDSGLFKDWIGNVWCNPPYSRGNLLAFASKMDFEFQKGRLRNGILLTPNSTDASWFKILAENLICLTNHRIPFLTYDKEKKMFFIEPNPENGSCFTLFTHDPKIKENFIKEFSKIGHVFHKVKERNAEYATNEESYCSTTATS